MNRFAPKRRYFAAVKKFPISLAVFILVMAAFIFGISNAADSKIMNEKEILTNALQCDIIHCYAVEGIYPPSLGYIEEHYGLIYDKDRFIINYVNEGANISPTFVIIER